MAEEFRPEAAAEREATELLFQEELKQLLYPDKQLQLEVAVMAATFQRDTFQELEADFLHQEILSLQEEEQQFQPETGQILQVLQMETFTETADLVGEHLTEVVPQVQEIKEDILLQKEIQEEHQEIQTSKVLVVEELQQRAVQTRQGLAEAVLREETEFLIQSPDHQ